MADNAAGIRSFWQNLAIRMMRRIIRENVVNIKLGNGVLSENEDCYLISEPDFLSALRMMVNPHYWIPESYCREKWTVINGDLSDLLTEAQNKAPRSFKLYMKILQSYFSPMHIIKQILFTKYYSRLVVDHYEISPFVYERFLDENLVYTCAFYDEEHTTLEQAQDLKFATVLQRLHLPENPHLLNIGCGWGSFERYVVKNNVSAKIDGISISKAQVEYARNKNALELSNQENKRVNFRVVDYVDLVESDHYDAITAIGMVEHVGLSGYPEFFRKNYSLLKDNGILLVHMIVKSESNIPTNSWIDKFIFPGGYSPSISELTRGAEGVGFRIKNIHIHHPINYKKTLRDWRRKLEMNKEEIVDFYNKKNINGNYIYKQWEFYLASSESSFSIEKEPLQIAHFVFEKYIII